MNGFPIPSVDADELLNLHEILLTVSEISIPTMPLPFRVVAVAQLVRASDCGSEGRRFKSG